MALAVSTCACVCICMRSQRRSLWCEKALPMYQQAPPQMARDIMMQAKTGEALANSRNRVGTSVILHMLFLFFAGCDLWDWGEDGEGDGAGGGVACEGHGSLV